MEQPSQTFETAIGRLEQIVQQMERGDAPLEEALRLFEEGAGLLRTCTKLLDDAELKVMRVMKGADGQPVTEEFSEVEA